MLDGIKQFYLSMRFKINRLETPLKGDNVKALIKTSNCENWSFISLRSQKIAFALLLKVFSDQTIARKKIWLPASLKI